ncbi:MAG: hypothetical protein GEU88_01250 [Solirubrobacterales bacterium]|nr:hypothetical protein [Solirubrobacterales bacterium]
MAEPADALRELAASLRDEGSVISPHVREPDQLDPGLGQLAARGERAAGAPHAYALIVESVREGYLLHYAGGRVVVGADRDLALLAGDYLYALGLERLARLGDLDAVRELSDLITLSAQVHGEPDRGADRAARELSALWLASTLVVGAGADRRHERGKSALRAGDVSAAAMFGEAVRERCDELGLGDELGRAVDSINCA